MSKTKIEWCDEVWNPVWGCFGECPYCYARKIACRFGRIMWKREMVFISKIYNNNLTNPRKLYDALISFYPVWLESNFQKKFSQNSSKIFVNSMSDIAWWEKKWTKKILKKIKEYPHHRFIILTKRPDLIRINEKIDNLWIGISISNQIDFERLRKDFFRIPAGKYIISIEPMHGAVDLERIRSDKNKIVSDLSYIDWVIVGAETGNRKGKITPKFQWILNIINQCKDNNIPIFIKNNMKDYCQLIQEQPNEN